MTQTAVTRPAYRPYATRVRAVAELSPHFVRVTLEGEALRDFGTGGLDQRIKILVPFEDGSTADIGAEDERSLASGQWYARWRALPDRERNPLRSYTVRAVRPEAGQIDVDVVRHEALPGTSLGPAARWIRRAAAGDRLVVVGPDERSPDSRSGIDWQPGGARRVLLAADETAVPAACAILESLPPEVRACAMLEVPCAADILPIVSRAQLRVDWFPRDRGDAHLRPGSLLPGALRAWTARTPEAWRGATARTVQEPAEIDIDAERIWEAPAADGPAARRPFYAWLAGEQAAIKRMRRHLVGELGLERRLVAFMGYWRYGVADLR